MQIALQISSTTAPTIKTAVQSPIEPPLKYPLIGERNRLARSNANPIVIPVIAADGIWVEADRERSATSVLLVAQRSTKTMTNRKRINFRPTISIRVCCSAVKTRDTLLPRRVGQTIAQSAINKITSG